MSDTVYILCNDFKYDGINIIGVYDDIALAKQAAVEDYVSSIDLTFPHTEYVIFFSRVNSKADDCVDFIVDDDAIIAYGRLYV